MIWIQRLILAALVIYFIILALVYIFQRNLLYFPPEFYNAPPDWLSEIKASDGSMAWWAAPVRETAPIVFVFHGNASAIDSNMHIFRDLRDHGYGIMSIGYPGYPGNEGAPTQTDLVAAATAQYDWVKDQGFSSNPRVFYGTSLGSGIASQVAATRDISMLVLDAPFESTLAIAKSQMRFLPVGLLMKDTYRSDLALSQIDTPLVWIHGREDRVIPLSSGQSLFNGYAGPKSAHHLEGADHINTWLMGGREIVLAALDKMEIAENIPNN